MVYSSNDNEYEKFSLRSNNTEIAASLPAPRNDARKFKNLKNFLLFNGLEPFFFTVFLTKFIEFIF